MRAPYAKSPSVCPLESGSRLRESIENLSRSWHPRRSLVQSKVQRERMQGTEGAPLRGAHDQLGEKNLGGRSTGPAGAVQLGSVLDSPGGLPLQRTNSRGAAKNPPGSSATPRRESSWTSFSLLLLHRSAPGRLVRRWLICRPVIWGRPRSGGDALALGPPVGPGLRLPPWNHSTTSRPFLCQPPGRAPRSLSYLPSSNPATWPSVPKSTHHFVSTL